MNDLLRMVSSSGGREPLGAIVPAGGPHLRRTAGPETEAFTPDASDGERRDGAASRPQIRAEIRYAARSYSTAFLTQVAAQHDEDERRAGAGYEAVADGPPDSRFGEASTAYRRTTGLTVAYLGTYAPVDLRV